MRSIADNSLPSLVWLGLHTLLGELDSESEDARIGWLFLQWEASTQFRYFWLPLHDSERSNHRLPFFTTFGVAVLLEQTIQSIASIYTVTRVRVRRYLRGPYLFGFQSRENFVRWGPATHLVTGDHFKPVFSE